MDPDTVPTGLDTLTAEWLTQALCQAGTLVKGCVVAFDVEKMPNANGQMLRLTLRYDHDEGAPSTVIAKFPSANPQWRAFWTEFHAYEREVYFYQHLAKSS